MNRIRRRKTGSSSDGFSAGRDGACARPPGRRDARRHAGNLHPKNQKPDEPEFIRLKSLNCDQGFQIMSATMRPAGMNGITCVL